MHQYKYKTNTYSFYIYKQQPRGNRDFIYTGKCMQINCREKWIRKVQDLEEDTVHTHQLLITVHYLPLSLRAESDTNFPSHDLAGSAGCPQTEPLSSAPGGDRAFTVPAGSLVSSKKLMHMVTAGPKRMRISHRLF